MPAITRAKYSPISEERKNQLLAGRPSVNPQPIPQPTQKPWPMLAERLGRLRKPDEAGLGDTVHRVLSRMGGRQFEWLMQRLGIDCGCGSRQKWLNNRYPY